MSKANGNINMGLKKVGFFLPVTWYGFLFMAAVYICYRWLGTQQQQPDSSFGDIFALLIRVATWFIVAVLALALLSVLLSYLFFLFKKKKQQAEFSIETVTGKTSGRRRLQVLRMALQPVLKPLLGFVKLRIQYDEEHFSDKFSLVERAFNKLINTRLEGTYNWPLPEIKEYKLKNVIIYFEDFFQFFSLAIQIPANSRFYTQPFEKTKDIFDASPRKTEDTNTRIEEIKRIEGEYLNYKNFEDNDDVRRIVWKIYAKNKELVVRIPEILDPYASHMYLYASFFSSYDIEGNEVVNIPFLNYYKTVLWSVYQQLVKKGFDVKYIPDQVLPLHHSTDEQQNVRYNISTSRWQTDKDLLSFVKTNEAAMVVVSSLSNAEEVAQLAERYGDEIVIVFVRLSNGLRKQYVTDWLQWVFIQQEKNDLAVYRTRWSVSTLKSKMLRNEKKIKAILEKYNKPVTV